ncbi:uncharacterized protein LAESUDRAFT_764948 [Laetiporus sulphureus 93-53]|uniref:Uncharacterized protein n=1 Tax=Laetiporus sulphureus 93-53 TaxID=1314785 RepID=A0A165B1A3_9APHY|nr:uncharacterized protein LAESUDRAFT_764948 [Laetiporus sulphureus 93-53]KZT00039.1 hypothetical protein LAESUDRAFT_764948 [Laetiporus sulphureus 93-53]
METVIRQPGGRDAPCLLTPHLSSRNEDPEGNIGVPMANMGACMPTSFTTAGSLSLICVGVQAGSDVYCRTLLTRSRDVSWVGIAESSRRRPEVGDTHAKQATGTPASHLGMDVGV